nr:hypothetical protein [Tanacetum cinerariifolium]
MAAFQCLDELVVAANSRSLFDAIMLYFKRETTNNLEFASDLHNLWLLDQVQQNDCIRLLTMRDMMAETYREVHKKIDFVSVMKNIMGQATTNRGLAAGTIGLVVSQCLGRGNTTIPIRGDYLIGLGAQITTATSLAGGSVRTRSITVAEVIDDCMSPQRINSTEDETGPPATHGTRSPSSKSLTKLTT